MHLSGEIFSTMLSYLIMHTSVPLPWFAASFFSYFFRISDTVWLLFSPLSTSSISLPMSFLRVSPPNFSANSSSNSRVLCSAYMHFSNNRKHQGNGRGHVAKYNHIIHNEHSCKGENLSIPKAKKQVSFLSYSSVVQSFKD